MGISEPPPEQPGSPPNGVPFPPDDTKDPLSHYYQYRPYPVNPTPKDYNSFQTYDDIKAYEKAKAEFYAKHKQWHNDFATWMNAYVASLPDEEDEEDEEPDFSVEQTRAPAVPLSRPLDRRPGTAAVLGEGLDTHQLVSILDRYRTQHLTVVGKTGQGKTTLLEHLILADLANGTSAVLIDPHGDLSYRVVSLASQTERERITLLEVWPDSPFRLNLLEGAEEDTDRTVGNIITLFKRLFNAEATDYAPRLQQVLDIALRTLIPNGATLADIPDLFTNAPFRQRLIPNVRNPSVLTFWTWYESLRLIDQTSYVESTLNRLSTFLNSDTMRATITTQKTTVPFASVLTQDGHLLILRIPVGDRSDTYARFYGSLFLSLLTDRLFARSSQPNEKRHRLHLYLDEYGQFATSTTTALLQQARKYNLGATIAFQTLANLPTEQMQQAALQVGTFVLFQLTGKDADELVSAFPITPRKQWEETISEQWEETIMEVVGTKRKTAISPNPIETLTHRSGHTNQQLTDAVQAFLIPLQDKFEEVTHRPPTLHDLNVNFSSRRPFAKDLKEVMRLIDQLLITVMKQEQDITDDHIASLVAHIFIRLGAHASYYPFPAQGLYSIIRDSPEFKAKLTRHLSHAAQATDPATYFTKNHSDTHAPWAMLIATEHQRLREIHEGTLSCWRDDAHSSDPKRKANADHWIQRSKGWFAQATQKYTDEITQAVDKLEFDAAQLIIICRILAIEPVRVQTGQEEDDLRPHHITHPAHRIMHPAQTHQDARLELAGILANLQPFTAFYQTLSETGHALHGQVALSAPAAGGIDESVIQEVSERSRQRYGVPIEPPDEDNPPYLSGPPQGPEPQPPRPRISRRPPQTQQ